METLTFKDRVTDALRYWELRRIVYNLVVTAIVVTHFFLNPHRRLTADTILVTFLLAVLANVAYCAAYVVDMFIQYSGFAEQRSKIRLVVLFVGIAFAAVLTHYFAPGLFS